MKYEEAKSIGIECGLDTPEEHIGNIELHATMLFAYENMSKEIEELYKDAYALGVTSKEKMDEYYNYMSNKFSNAIKEEK